MKSRLFAVIAIFAAVAVIIGYKHLHNTPGQSTMDAGIGPGVVLVADLSEAEEKCACGEIIRAVRAARQKGVATQEFTADSKSEMLKQYRILTAPTVLFFDAKGKEIARYEGEDKKTVEEIRSQLKRMAEGELK